MVAGIRAWTIARRLRCTECSEQSGAPSVRRTIRDEPWCPQRRIAALMRGSGGRRPPQKCKNFSPPPRGRRRQGNDNPNSPSNPLQIQTVLWYKERGPPHGVVNPVEGISTADIDHFFKPFWRKDAARTDGSHSGLGLTLVRTYAEILGGSALASLTDGHLLSVAVDLPIDEGDKGASKDFAAPSSPGHLEGVQ